MISYTLTFSSLLSLVAALPPYGGGPPFGGPFGGSQQCPRQPAYFALAGDSTTAVQASGGGGWGNGFLNDTLACGSTGHNWGHNGATTASFRAGGDWANVLADVANAKSKNYNPVYVTIQFGHNDQKNTSGVSLSQYTSNLETFAKEVQSAGAVPILVTPLTRRSYSNTTGYPLINEDLNQNRFTTIQAAHSTNSRYIDLNAASVSYCDQVGPAACWVYNLQDGGNVTQLNGTDHTHINYWGSVVFGRLVSDLMVAKFPDVAAVTKPNATMSYQLANGIPV